jgi:hypothetical protein
MDDLNSLYRNKSHAYYIYSPRWIETSAGIRALHYLCHSLNNRGHKAYLVMTEVGIKGVPRVSGYLNTPILTQEIADSHFRAKVTPITIYTETIPGNPLKAPFVIRYLMNYIGSLNGPRVFDAEENLLAFSQNISIDTSEKLGNPNIPVLFIPPVDPREFDFIPGQREDLVAIYVGKYKAFVGEPPRIPGISTIEIRREGKEAQNRKQIRELLRQVRAVIAYENSSILTEAVLSGTVAVFQPNSFLDSAIGEKELGWGGSAWGWSEDNFKRASETLAVGKEQYILQISRYFSELEKFVSATQTQANEVPYVKCIVVPKHLYLFSGHRIRMSIQILKSGGVKKLLNVTLDFTKRRLRYSYWLHRNTAFNQEVIDYELDWTNG